MKHLLLLLTITISVAANATSPAPLYKYLVCFPTDANSTTNLKDATLYYGPMAWQKIVQASKNAQEVTAEGVLAVTNKQNNRMKYGVSTHHDGSGILWVKSNARGFKVELNWKDAKHVVVNNKHAFVLPHSVISVFDLRASYVGNITCSAP